MQEQQKGTRRAPAEVQSMSPQTGPSQCSGQTQHFIGNLFGNVLSRILGKLHDGWEVTRLDDWCLFAKNKLFN